MRLSSEKSSLGAPVPADWLHKRRDCGEVRPGWLQDKRYHGLRPLRFVVVLCLAVCGLLVGCSGLDLRGEPFPDDPLARAGRQWRPPQRDGELFGFSNKARQIERNLGIDPDR